MTGATGPLHERLSKDALKWAPVLAAQLHSHAAEISAERLVCCLHSISATLAAQPASKQPSAPDATRMWLLRCASELVEAWPAALASAETTAWQVILIRFAATSHMSEICFTRWVKCRH